MAELVKVIMTLLYIAAFALVCYFIARSRKKKLPPGPLGLPLLGSLPFLTPDLHRHFDGLAKKYGPVMSLRLGTKLCVVLSSPAAAKELFKDRDAVFAYRDVPITAAIITKGGAEIGWNNDPASWRFLRKVTVKELLSSSSFDGFWKLREREVRRMTKEIYERRGTKVLVGEASFQVLLDLMMSMFWGETVEEVERESLGKEFREVILGITELLSYPNVSDFFPALAPLDLQGVGRKMKKIAQWCDEVLDRINDKRLSLARDGTGRGRDFLRVMLDVVEKKETELPLTIDHVKAIFLDIVTAATDTTSATVEFAMAEMMEKPKVLKKVQAELDAVVGKEAVVQESHLSHLPYLDAVVKETLRLHPPLPLMVPHTPSEASELGGFDVPVGSRVLVNAWGIHRDPSVWENPSVFWPERFVEDDSLLDYTGGRNGFRFFPFGSGRRICPGIPMAEKMSVYLLATMLHSFDWQLPTGDRIDFTETISMVLRMAKPFTAIPSPRLSNHDLYS